MQLLEFSVIELNQILFAFFLHTYLQIHCLSHKNTLFLDKKYLYYGFTGISDEYMATTLIEKDGNKIFPLSNTCLDLM